ncbi:hypothetical protein C494_19492 [Natronorubrum bangense JCM 10635]|uniref:Uncharacterized protein n=1 Tax=Natronorubrum bangense JCM 10635 TaxID=1227500 RepID=L9W131_9EURY|nr:hypothetical protein C494_19492 [Natronorubrum bangense JCM 10635]
MEKATGIPPTGTPGHRGFHIHTGFSLASDSARRSSTEHEGCDDDFSGYRSLNSSLEFESGGYRAL